MVATATAPASPDKPPIPKKLRDDAILEAVCSLQFKTTDLPELVIGRLSLETKWKDFKPQRLPFADVPVPVRNADPNLKAQPVFELRSADGSRVVRLGSRLVSRLVFMPYIDGALPFGGVLYLNQITNTHISAFDRATPVCAVTAYGLRHIEYSLENHLLRPKDDRLAFGQG